METNDTVYIVTKNYDYDSGILKVFNSLDKAQKYCEDELQKYIDNLDLSASFYSTEHNCENCKDKTINCKNMQIGVNTIMIMHIIVLEQLQ